jgi:hypothetical protein
MADKRYSINKYNTFKYGASTSDAQFAWGVEVDWNNDGVFTGANEAQYMNQISILRGRVRQLKSSGEGFEQVATGKLTVELNNSSGRYNGWNTASPLYPNVTYGRDIKITIRDWVTGVTQPVFYGVISDLATTGYGEDARVIISADDAWTFLRNYPSRIAIQTGLTPDTAIGQVLDSISWPARWGRNLAASADTIGYWWTSGSKIAATELEDIAESFLGHFYVNASGQAAFKARTTTDATITDFPQGVMLKDVANPQPWVNSRNIVKVKVHPRTVSGTVVLYQLLGNTPSVLTGASNYINIFGTYNYNNNTVPAYSIAAPVATTDWTTNTAADGSGTDKTADCTVVATNLGDTVKLKITNNSGGTVYVTKLQVQGVALYEASASDVVSPTDTSGITQPREFVLDRPWIQDVNYAIDQAGVLATYFAALNPYPAVQVENRFANQFGIDLFDTVTVNLGALGISGNSYKIGGIEHRSYGDNCQKVVTKFYLEPYPFSGAYWLWDTRSTFNTDIFGA